METSSSSSVFKWERFKGPVTERGVRMDAIADAENVKAGAVLCVSQDGQ